MFSQSAVKKILDLSLFLSESIVWSFSIPISSIRFDYSENLIAEISQKVICFPLTRLFANSTYHYLKFNIWGLTGLFKRGEGDSLKGTGGKEII